MQITSRIILIILCCYGSQSFAFDVCSDNGFTKINHGWIRAMSNGHDVFVDFKISVKELREGEDVDFSDDLAPVLARDAASTAYYKYFQKINPSPVINADLSFSGTESTVDRCFFTKTFGYRTPLNSFKWVLEKN